MTETIDPLVIDIISGERSDTQGQRDELDRSLLRLGLLNAITVVARSDLPGRYLCVAGRRRLRSAQRIGWDRVDCNLRTFSDLEREMAEIAENLLRLELTRDERDRALARYLDLYNARESDRPVLIYEQRKGNLRQFDEGEPDGPWPEDDPGMDPDRGWHLEVAGDPETPEPASSPLPPSAEEVVAERFGVTMKTVKKAAKRAGAFTDDQRAVLEAAHLSLLKMDRIAAVKDPAKRCAIVNLIAAAMDYDAAMREILGALWEGDSEEDEDFTDEEFLQSCSAIRDRVNKVKFDEDALLYRKLQKARIILARAVGWTSLKAEVNGSAYSRGPYYQRLARFLDAPHPRHWLTCGNCVRGVPKGPAGHAGVGTCRDCQGGGYRLG